MTTVSGRASPSLFMTTRPHRPHPLPKPKAMTTNITDTEFLADILQGVDKRLDYIAGEINSDPKSPALAEIRAARKAVERAEILLGKWVPSSVPYSHVHNDEDACETILEAFPDMPDDHLVDAVVEAHAEHPEAWVRVTMPRCVWLLSSLFNETATSEIYTCAHTLPLHDGLRIYYWACISGCRLKE